ncbi:MAG: PQQ-binding-like beta-propeller repeat protein [Planctomycetes bacterium]|nr:PQQ-binding-like beta-propeller repeat protein [Planctomycetota bacterium]
MANKAILLLIAVTAIVFVPGQQTSLSDDWTSSGYGLQRTRATAETGFNETLTQVWKYSAHYPIVSSPAVSDGCVFFGCRDNSFYALDALTGAQLWKYETDDIIDSSPVVYKGWVVFAGRNGTLYCLDSASGALQWSYYTRSHLLSSPAIFNDKIYIGLSFPEKKLLCIPITGGTADWEFTAEQGICSSPAVKDGLVYFGCNSGRIYCLDAFTGEEKWNQATDGGVLFSSPLITDTLAIFIPGDNDLNVYAFNKDTGNPVWTNDSGNPYKTILNKAYIVQKRIIDHQKLLSGKVQTKQISDTPAQEKPSNAGAGNSQAPSSWQAVTVSSPMLVNNSIVFITGYPDQAVYSLNPADGSLIWANTAIGNALRYGFSSTPAASGNYIYAGSAESKTLYAIDASSGEIMAGQIQLDDAICSSPALSNGMIYVATMEGTLYCFSTTANQPPAAPTNLSPASLELTIDPTPTISWTAASDPDDAASILHYIVRTDFDGEVLHDWSYDEFVTNNGETSVTMPLDIPAGSTLYYAVRAVDSKGAMSPWSAVQDFYINMSSSSTPGEPEDLLSVPENESVQLTWNAPSATAPADLMGYYVLTMADAAVIGNGAQYVGNVNSFTVNGLTNFSTYTFFVWAVNYANQTGPDVNTSATPLPAISINETGYTSVYDAAEAAAPGDTILLNSGTIYITETLRLTEGVSLKGFAAYSPSNTAGKPYTGQLQGNLDKVTSSAGFTIFDGTGMEKIVYVQKGNTSDVGTISGIVFIGGDIAIDTGQAFVNITNNVFTETGTDAVLCSPSSGPQVINNTFTGNIGNAVHILNSKPVIRNNIIIGNTGYGILAEQSGDATVSYNDVYNNGLGDYSGVSAGEGDISASVSFKNAAKYDFRELTGSITIDAGDPDDEYANEPLPNGGRINIGAYGNTVFAVLGAVLENTDDGGTPPPDDGGTTPPPDDTTPPPDTGTPPPDGETPPVDDGGTIYTPPIDDTGTPGIAETSKKGKKSKCFITTIFAGAKSGVEKAEKPKR